MTDEKLVEVVARALCTAEDHDPNFDYDPNGVNDLPGVNLRWKLYKMQARAAIAAYEAAKGGGKAVAWMIVAPGCVCGPVETMESVALNRAARMYPPGTEIRPLYAHSSIAAPAAPPAVDLEKPA